METAIAYAAARQQAFLDELYNFLRIPSISTLPEHASEVQTAANWVANALRSMDMERVTVFETECHPIVYGEMIADADAPTILIYGHYDVQPVDPIAEWKSPPFEPVIRDDHIVARGAADDKGQLFLNLKAVEALLHAYDGTLPANVKFLIEGEEEIGSPSLEKFITAHRELLGADVVVISDSTMLSLEQPAISVAFRGMLYMELSIEGPAFDLHSGQHGGVVHNPAQAICEIIAGLHNSDGSVAVDGFYDRVQPIDSDERRELEALYSEEEFRAETGAPRSWGDERFSLRARIVARPTLEINGVSSGWTGPGQKTVLPAKAMAKISCRLVPDQDPYEIEQLVRKRIAELTPPTVRSRLRLISHGYPLRIPADNVAIDIARRAYLRGFGVEPILMRKGGSLPVAEMLTRLMQVPVVLAGYGLPSDRVHGPNERFHLACFERGLKTAIALYDGLGQVPKSQLKPSP